MESSRLCPAEPGDRRTRALGGETGKDLSESTKHLSVSAIVERHHQPQNSAEVTTPWPSRPWMRTWNMIDSSPRTLKGIAETGTQLGPKVPSDRKIGRSRSTGFVGGQVAVSLPGLSFGFVASQAVATWSWRRLVDDLRRLECPTHGVRTEGVPVRPAGFSDQRATAGLPHRVVARPFEVNPSQL